LRVWGVGGWRFLGGGLGERAWGLKKSMAPGAGSCLSVCRCDADAGLMKAGVGAEKKRRGLMRHRGMGSNAERHGDGIGSASLPCRLQGLTAAGMWP
jgi:hypothetical protein